MVDKPDQFPEWAKEEIVNDTSGQLNRVEPPEFIKDEGWRRREIPPRQWWNWLAHKVYLWVLWFEDQIENFCVRDDSGLPSFLIRAWANFDGTDFDENGICEVRGSGNIQEVERDEVGRYIVRFDTNMPDANYSVVVSGGEPAQAYFTRCDNFTSSSFRIVCRLRAGDQDLSDFSIVSFQVVR